MGAHDQPAAASSMPTYVADGETGSTARLDKGPGPESATSDTGGPNPGVSDQTERLTGNAPPLAAEGEAPLAAEATEALDGLTSIPAGAPEGLDLAALLRAGSGSTTVSFGSPLNLPQDGKQQPVGRLTGTKYSGQPSAAGPTGTGLQNSSDSDANEPTVSLTDLNKASRELSLSFIDSGIESGSPPRFDSAQGDRSFGSRSKEISGDDRSSGGADREPTTGGNGNDAAFPLSASGESPRLVEPHAPPAAPGAAPARAPATPVTHLPARVAQIAAAMNEPGSRSVRLRLDPPSLGEVRVHVESGARGITVRIVAQTPEACALLSDHQSELSRELWRHGLALQSFSATLAGDAGQEQMRGRERTPSGRRSALVQSLDGPAFMSQPVHPPPATIRAGGLDARA